METKTSKAIGLFKDGRLRDALAIFKTFKIGFTKDERRTIQIALLVFVSILVLPKTIYLISIEIF